MTIQTTDNPNSDAVLKVERPFYDKQEFNNALYYNRTKDKKSSNSSINVQPFKVFLSIFPVFSWLSRYSIKRDLISDMISGFTVGVMHIPQGCSMTTTQFVFMMFETRKFVFYDVILGMGYAMLASVPPIIGIYTAFFPVVIYFIFGTSRHNSMGTFSVISIMVGKVVAKYSQIPDGVQMMHNSTGIENGALPLHQPIYTPMHVVSSLCIVMAGFHVNICFQFDMFFLFLFIFSFSSFS